MAERDSFLLRLGDKNISDVITAGLRALGCTWGETTLFTGAWKAHLDALLAERDAARAAATYWRALLADTMIGLRSQNISGEQVADAIQRAFKAADDLGALVAVPDTEKGAELVAQSAENADVREVVVLERDLLDGGWVASVLAAPGCLSQGETVGEALRNIAEAYEGWTAARSDRSVIGRASKPERSVSGGGGHG